MDYPTHLQSIGKNIKIGREHRNITTKELADLASLPESTIIEIENGTLNFEINTLIRISSALKFYIDITFVPA